jgi:hypothetical protein
MWIKHDGRPVDVQLRAERADSQERIAAAKHRYLVDHATPREVLAELSRIRAKHNLGTRTATRSTARSTRRTSSLAHVHTQREFDAWWANEFRR